MRTHKKMGEIAPGVQPTDAKTCSFVINTMHTVLSATYPASIFSIFEIKDMNRCAHE